MKYTQIIIVKEANPATGPVPSPHGGQILEDPSGST